MNLLQRINNIHAGSQWLHSSTTLQADGYLLHKRRRQGAEQLPDNFISSFNPRRLRIEMSGCLELQIIQYRTVRRSEMRVE